jgi:hypothetical protein
LCAGELREYVVEELNVRALETCDQPLQYAQLRAEPDWKVSSLHLPSELRLAHAKFISEKRALVTSPYDCNPRQSARGWPRPWARA